MGQKTGKYSKNHSEQCDGLMVKSKRFVNSLRKTQRTASTTVGSLNSSERRFVTKMWHRSFRKAPTTTWTTGKPSSSLRYRFEPSATASTTATTPTPKRKRPYLLTGSKLLNINTANEDDFMTLPLVDRTLARSIIDHRRVLGSFRQIEDLVLVPGLGVSKFNIIRNEITCSDHPDFIDSASAFGDGKLNLNEATVSELLQSNSGMPEKLATKICDYRDKKGGFQSIKQLKKVRGMTRKKFANLKSQFTVSNRDMHSNINQNVSPTSLRRSSRNSSIYRASVTSNCPYSNSRLMLQDIFHLMSLHSYRPIVEEEFENVRNSEKAIRIASWNLGNLVQEKAENYGFREVFCRTILENNISIIAVQEVADRIALKILCDELNNPTLAKVQNWQKNSRNWKYFLSTDCNSTVSSSNDQIRDSCGNLMGKFSLGFIYETKSFYDETIEINLTRCVYSQNETNHLLNDKFNSLICHFEIGEIDFFLVNLQIDLPVLNLNDLRTLLINSIPNFDQECCIVAGDFSQLSKPLYNELCDMLTPSVSIETTTNSLINAQKTDRCFDNIFLNQSIRSQFTGVSAAVKQGLTHLAIPNGWKWGGTATVHCPIFCELFVDILLFDCLSLVSVSDI